METKNTGKGTKLSCISRYISFQTTFQLETFEVICMFIEIVQELFKVSPGCWLILCVLGYIFRFE